jgi:hypothetical protein
VLKWREWQVASFESQQRHFVGMLFPLAMNSLTFTQLNSAFYLNWIENVHKLWVKIIGQGS